MSLEKPIEAEIVGVVDGHGPRVYRLKFKQPAGEVAYVRLSFGKYPSEREWFFKLLDDATVLVNAHACPDVEDIPAYYVWQRKMRRMTTQCPKCHRRLDAIPMRANSDKKLPSLSR